MNPRNAGVELKHARGKNTLLALSLQFPTVQVQTAIAAVLSDMDAGGSPRIGESPLLAPEAQNSPGVAALP